MWSMLADRSPTLLREVLMGITVLKDMVDVGYAVARFAGFCNSGFQ